MRRLTLLPALLATCAAVALPATADAIKLPTGKDTWQVSVKGKQTTTWKVHHVPDGTLSCDADQTGSGTETIRFASKPKKATAFVGGSFKGLLGQVALDAAGTVNRQGAIQTGVPLDLMSCPDGVGGADPTPDCGSKPFKHLFLSPAWDSRGRRLGLEQDTAVPLTPSFEHCPVVGVGWPSIQDARQAFPYAELADHGKHIVIATGSKSGRTADSTWTTRIRWEVTFKRVKSERF